MAPLTVVAAETGAFLAWADLAVKILALLALATGVFQLLEARRKRHVEIYWELMDRYLSPEGRDARRVASEIRHATNLSKQLLEELPGRTGGTEETRRSAAEYNKLFHGTDCRERQHVHPAVLYRLRYLNQAAVLLKKKLVDRDLLLGLIAAGVNIDRDVILITLAAVREREGFAVYPHVENLIREVDRYIREVDRYIGPVASEQTRPSGAT